MSPSRPDHPPLPKRRPGGVVAAPWNRARRRGFTLLEIMIVIAILAIAAVLIVPRFGGAATTRLREAARLLEADLNYARVESISHPAAPVVIGFDLEANRYRLLRSATHEPGGELKPITNPATRTPYVVTLGQGRAAQFEGVAIQSVTAGGDAIEKITYGAYGELAQSAPALIQLLADDQQVTLTLDPGAGEVRVGEIE